ncbi:hypothetical protein DL764_003256 [Monosporascus ibericus]|uniref:Alpha/beta hydrolase fold-3 domain-containing protein n=1 Tax=Monosporascus ibericus TaxID=155417 RepID=A0A4Q4TIW3_9PEZI|nr:hypothetical protein DL764_003256 [Monosporascus ibericus]
MRPKPKPEYVDLEADFKPLPKHGHLSQKTPEFVAAEPAIIAGYEKLWAAPDFAAVREMAGDADAVMPPGGPDRYREVTTELLQFPARDGEIIELKVYKPPNVVPDATLMYRMHGGGWCVGSHEVDGAENIYAAVKTNIVVCKNNAKALGINPEKIILAGSSAGANLAAALALEMRDSGITGIVAQILHFPTVCHPKFYPRDKYELGSYVQNSENCVLSVLSAEAFFDAYLPNPEPDHRHSPLLASSFEDLPPALIQCGGADILRDEAFAYAEALETARVDVEIYGYKGLPHCFPGSLLVIPETAEFYRRYNAFLKKFAGGS